MARYSRRSHHHRYTFSGITDAYFLTTPLPASYGNAVSQSRRAASPSDGPRSFIPTRPACQFINHFPQISSVRTRPFRIPIQDPSSPRYYSTSVASRYGRVHKEIGSRFEIVRIRNFWKRNLDWLEGTCIGIDDGRNKKEKKERGKKRSSSTKITNGSVRTGEFAGKE